MVTFAVDDVTPATEALPTRPLGELPPGEAFAFGGDPALRVLEPDGVHPLLSAIGRAFADHRPIVLSPDAVWLTIAQGVAQHVRLNAERLRPLLVNHSSRKRLTVAIEGPMPHDADSWRDIVESMHKLLAAEIADPGLFECDFSTSSAVDRVAGQVVLLDAYSPYFAYWLTCVCGIPSITLTGTVEDWRRIRSRIAVLEVFGLEKWCRSLAPIADQFVRAASGDVDTAFWRRIYNPVDAYGGEVITGWAARLYPYLEADGTLDRPNPLLDLPIGEPRNAVSDGGWYNGPGIRSDSVPARLSRVTITVNDKVAGENRAIAVHAGLVGIAQDDDGALRPVSGWHVAPATVEIDDVIDRIIAGHETEPPGPPGHFMSGAADMLALYRRIGAATLFDGAWRLVPAADQRQVPRGLGKLPLVTVIDLADGRSICSAEDYERETIHWVLARIEPVPEDQRTQYDPGHHLADDPADVPVLGTSLALLLDAAIDSGGDITHLETGRSLADVDR